MPSGRRNLLKNDVLLNGQKDSSIQRAARFFLTSSLSESKIHINIMCIIYIIRVCICIRKVVSRIILHFSLSDNNFADF